MIVGELLDSARADEIDAAVADVRDRKKIFLDQDRHDGRSHAGFASAFGSNFDDFGIRFSDGASQRVSAIGKSFDRIADGRVVPLAGLAEVIKHDVDTDLAGHLAGSLSTHAVANHKNAELGVITEVVFVIGADAAYVTLAR